MSRGFEFRKLYADLVGDDGDVVVLYLNFVRLAGVWTARTSVEHYAPDGTLTTAQGTDPPQVLDDEAELGSIELQTRLASGRFTLDVDVVQGPWQPATPPPTDGLHWHVKAVRTRGRATWNGTTIDGTGYADWVRITRPTRLLGLRRLFWGRVHLPDRSVILEQIHTTSGAVWEVGVAWPIGGEAQGLAGPIEVGTDGECRAKLANGTLGLRRVRVLHDGDAFAPERVPRAVDRWLCNLVGGPTHETRFTGIGRVGEVTGPALYEVVQFGR